MRNVTGYLVVFLMDMPVQNRHVLHFLLRHWQLSVTKL